MLNLEKYKEKNHSLFHSLEAAIVNILVYCLLVNFILVFLCNFLWVEIIYVVLYAFNNFPYH